MKSSFVEVSDNDLCPCGSSKTYRRRCKKKSFRFGYQDDRLVKRIRIAEDLTFLLDEERALFRDMYGREPSKHDFVFPFAGVSVEQIAMDTVYALREIGIPENKIYAYHKNDGLIPCSSNLGLLPETELQRFADLCKEYDEAMAQPLSDGQLNVLQLIAFANEHLRNTYNDTNSRIKMALNDYIRRHSKCVSLYDYEIRTINDYCIFLAAKTIRTLVGIEKLYEAHLADGIYVLARGIFESYMHINAINHSGSFFESKIAPKIDAANFSFDKYPSGKTNYKRVIHNDSGEARDVRVKIYDLGRYFKNVYDTNLYELFYEPACRYVHTDVLSAQSYFRAFDPYDEIDPVLVAGVTAIAIAVILVEQIKISEGTQTQFREDADYLLGKMKEDLAACFDVMASDSEHQNAVYQTLAERLQLKD